MYGSKAVEGPRAQPLVLLVGMQGQDGVRVEAEGGQERRVKHGYIEKRVQKVQVHRRLARQRQVVRYPPPSISRVAHSTIPAADAYGQGMLATLGACLVLATRKDRPYSRELLVNDGCGLPSGA